MPMHTKPIAFDANTADDQSVARWIQTSLDSYIKDGVGRWAFRPLEHHIGMRDDLAEDLRAIYDSLPAAAQTRWRLAIHDLLATQGPDISKREATRVLIDFAILVRAHEVLEVLPALIANGRGDERLLDQVVRAAIALASQTEASRDCLKRICTSPKFVPDYAGLVLVALCHADPDNWLAHVENLAAPMQILATRLSDGSTALRFYASTILEAISLSRVTGVAANHLFGRAESRWLWNEWFKGGQSLIRYEEFKIDSSARLLLRANEAVSVPIDKNLAAWNLDDAAKGTVQESAATIAWVRAPRSHFWTAIFQDGHLDELTLKYRDDCIAAMHSFLTVHQKDELESPSFSRWTLDQHRAEMETAMPDFAGILIRPSARSTAQVIIHDPTSLWDGPVSNRYTDRVKYLKKYGKWVQPHDFRTAIGNQYAFSAAASAIGLAKERSIAA